VQGRKQLSLGLVGLPQAVHHSTGSPAALDLITVSAVVLLIFLAVFHIKDLPAVLAVVLLVQEVTPLAVQELQAKVMRVEILQTDTMALAAAAVRLPQAVTLPVRREALVALV
jgi:hypothetical protein